MSNCLRFFSDSQEQCFTSNSDYCWFRFLLRTLKNSALRRTVYCCARPRVYFELSAQLSCAICLTTRMKLLKIKLLLSDDLKSRPQNLSRSTAIALIIGKFGNKDGRTTAQSPASSINLRIISVLCSSTALESMQCEFTTD